MKFNTLSLCLSLGLSIISSLPASAASIDPDNLQLIPVTELDFDFALSFSGEPENNQGQTAIFNSDPTAPDFGHAEISQNSPPNQFAPYYTTGRQSSPEQSGATRATTLDGGMGFTNFFNYLNTNSLDSADIGFGYGQKDELPFTETWNLGDDILGQDYLASTDSTLEERIYQANPDNVESFLVFDDTKFINFGYSPFYVAFDKGETIAFSDDSEIVLTEVIGAQKTSGLNPFLDGLAEAFLLDVELQGGGLQIFSEDTGIAEPVPIFDPSTGYATVNLPLPLSIRAVNVSVPEPSAIFSLFLVGILSNLLRKRPQN